MTETLHPTTRIKNHFIQLLSETRYTKITMTCLAQELGMSRQNLYKYYSSKEEIIEDVSIDLVENLLIELTRFDLNSDPNNWASFLQSLLSRVEDNSETFIAIFKNDSDDFTFRYIKNFVTRTLGYIARTQNITIQDHDYFNMLVRSTTGALFHLCKEWMEQDMRIPSHKVNLLLINHLNPAIIQKLKVCEEGSGANESLEAMTKHNEWADL